MVAACPFPSVQGSQILIQELITGLCGRGHQVHLVTYPFGATSTWRRPQNCRIHRAKIRTSYPADHSGPHIYKPFMDMALARLLKKIIRQEKVDLVHAHSHEGLIAALWVRRKVPTPILYHSHTLLGEELPTYFRTRSLRILAKALGTGADWWFPRLADHCIALSPRTAQWFQKMKFSSGRVHYLPPFSFPPSPSNFQYPLEHEPESYILYAGNLHQYQDIELLFQSFRIVASQEPETNLVVLTHNDPAESQLRLDKLGLQDRVFFKKGITMEEEWRWMTHARALALPRTRCSGYPIKLLNYMAVGRPIVVSADSARNLTHGENAFVVLNSKPENFAMGLLTTLRSERLSRTIANGAARTFQKEMNPETLLERVEVIYEKLSPRQKNDFLGKTEERIPNNSSCLRARKTCLLPTSYHSD